MDAVFDVNGRSVKASVLPDFDPDQPRAFLWGVMAPGYRPTRPQPQRDDPRARHWRPPIAPIKRGGRCESLEDGMNICEREVDDLRQSPLKEAAS